MTRNSNKIPLLAVVGVGGLEDTGVKLAVVASDVLGVSGRAMLEALLGYRAGTKARRLPT